MNLSVGNQKAHDIKTGVIAGILAYSIWGAFPIYFKVTEMVSPLEILAHRIVWSLPFALFIILLRRQWRELKLALQNKRLVALLCLSSITLAINWGVYIWAIQQDQIFQGSLGYYINPLMYVLVGVVFFKERLTRLQLIAVLCALAGVAILTLYGGVFPTISLILATSFTAYGVIRKQAVVGAIPGLAIETLVIFPPAAGFLIWVANQGTLNFGTSGPITSLLLLAGPITVLPLWAFAVAARRLKLSTIGILQYIGPTGQFICALYYGETFTAAHAWCFGFIWLGIVFFSYSAFKLQKSETATSKSVLKSP